jgi:hypothetical protein
VVASIIFISLNKLLNPPDRKKETFSCTLSQNLAKKILSNYSPQKNMDMSALPSSGAPANGLLPPRTRGPIIAKLAATNDMQSRLSEGACRR